MGKLSPRQVDDLANRILGGVESFEYRSANQIDQFFDFAEIDVTEAGGGSRFSR
jgi:hypothetical protein